MPLGMAHRYLSKNNGPRGVVFQNNQHLNFSFAISDFRRNQTICSHITTTALEAGLSWAD